MEELTPGYLVARLLINHENRFIVEGQGGLKHTFSRISDNPITVADLNAVVQHTLMIAIDNDLIAHLYRMCALSRFTKRWNARQNWVPGKNWIPDELPK